MAEDQQTAVHCLVCSKLVTLPKGQGAGATLKCPFCFAEFTVVEKTVLVAHSLTEGTKAD